MEQSTSSSGRTTTAAASPEVRVGRGPVLLSGLMFVIGLGAVGLLLLAIWGSPGIQAALTWVPSDETPQRPSLILAFLDGFGLVQPILIVLLAGFMIRLGLKLRTADIAAARSAQIALFWLIVGLILLALLALVNWLATPADVVIDPAVRLRQIGLPLLVLLPLGAALLWLNANIDRSFHGDERLSARETRLAWNLLIPTLTVVILVAGRPLEQTFIRSLTDKRFAGGEVPSFVGLENYRNLLGIRFDVVSCRLDDDTGACRQRDDGSIRWASIERDLLETGFRTVWTIPVPFVGGQALAISGLDDDFLEGIGTTLIFTVVSVSLELVIGLFMALTVNSKFAGRGLMRAVMLIPWAIPTVISARLWELMLKDTSAGIVNVVAMDLGLINAPQAWLTDPSLQVPAAIMVDVWKTAPFMGLLLLAGLQTIPGDLYEAASVDGASRVRRFFAITLPLLRPAIAVALVFRTLDALRVFDLFNVLFGRQQLSMATYNYEMLVNNQRDGYASAISVIIFIFISIFAIIYVRMLNVERNA